MLMSRDRRLLGRLVSGRLLHTLGWTVTGLISLLSVALVASQILST
jgi:Mn2+/Fe2+ NRAMP family transporter